MDIHKLLNPSSMAIIGASEKPGMAFGTLTNILTYQEADIPAFFVNPNYDTVFGKKCYRDIAEVPGTFDLAVICTSRRNVISSLYEVKQKGCKAAVVFASGYAETGSEEGIQIENELVKAAQELDIALMGPNCGGFINFLDSKFAFAFEGNYSSKVGKIGFVSQSGQFCIDMMNSYDLKFSYVVSTGNSCVLSIEDYLDFLVDDAGTAVIALYLEGIKNPKKFENSLRKAALVRKPIIIFKGGRSAQGAKNVASHTGSLAGNDEAYEAVFKKFGVIRALDLQDLRTTSMLFSTLKKIPSRANFGAMCMSGGETGICADLGFLHGIHYPRLETRTIKRLEELLPFYATPANPLDMTVTLSYNKEKFAEGISTVISDPNIDIGIIGFTITDKEPTEEEFTMFEGIKMLLERVETKPLIILPFVESSRYQPFAEQFLSLGVPILAAPQYGFLALEHLRDFIQYDHTDNDLRLSIPPEGTGEGIIMSEYESRKWMNQEGLEVYEGEISHSFEEAKAIAAAIGYPVVLKVSSDKIVHKTEIDGVKLNIRNEKQLQDSYHDILKNALTCLGERSAIDILVQKHFPPSLEMIVGTVLDQQFGHMLLIGIGGVMVEILKDTALFPIPVTKANIGSMLNSLKMKPLLHGFRNMPVLDEEAFVDFVKKVSDFVHNNSEKIITLELNPIFLYEAGLGVELGDAVIIRTEKQPE